MNENEKKAIDHIKNIKSWWWNNSPDRIYPINKEDIEQFDIALNLIGKQSSVLNKIKQLTKVIICDEDGKLQKMIYADELYETFRELEVEINE